MPIVALFKGLHSPNQARSQLSSPYEVSIRVYRLKVAPGQVDSVPLVECQSVYKLRQTQVKLSLGWISLQPRPSPYIIYLYYIIFLHFGHYMLYLYIISIKLSLLRA